VPTLELIVIRPSTAPLIPALFLTALLGLGCAQLMQIPAALAGKPPDLAAQGPETVFESAQAAAIDALTYAYLQACAARDTERMRGGTIYAVGEGFSYGEIHVANPGSVHRVEYTLQPQDVARFQMYPIVADYDINRVNERASLADRRSVRISDPLHRPLYILHPSLAIRAVRGEARRSVEIANLRSAAQPVLVADN